MGAGNKKPLPAGDKVHALQAKVIILFSEKQLYSLQLFFLVGRAEFGFP